MTKQNKEIETIVLNRADRLWDFEARSMYPIALYTISRDTIMHLPIMKDFGWLKVRNGSELYIPCLGKPIKIDNNLKLGAVGCEYEN